VNEIAQQFGAAGIRRRRALVNYLQVCFSSVSRQVIAADETIGVE